MPLRKPAYPYIPNATPEVRKAMLREIGVAKAMDLFDHIPPHLKYLQDLHLPEPIQDELTLKQHLNSLLNQNLHTEDCASFLGGGCAKHYVPAVCDEINSRAEFVTAYAAEFYADHGKWQALFEFGSLMAELLNMDVVNGLLYDAAQAMATSIRMASRMTGRNEVIVSENISPDIKMILTNYMRGVGTDQIRIHWANWDPRTGETDAQHVQNMITDNTAAICIQNPNYLGVLESKAPDLGQLAKSRGTEFIVATDPICLGVLAPPADYGATIACGDYHSLGLHLLAGGGLGGFIATPGEMRYMAEFKDKMYGIAPTQTPGEYGFANILFFRTSFGSREKAKEYSGTSNALWALTAGVYLALMGPQGMAEVGQTVMHKSQYAAQILQQVSGLTRPLESPFFKEFVLNFDQTGMTVAEVNKALLEERIFGGKDLSKAFPQLGQSALYCITECTTKAQIDNLAQTLERIIKSTQ